METNDLEILVTADGSPTLYNKALDDTYHSRHGAVTESTHVFIRHGLEYYIKQNNPKQVNIFELGYGTGLNPYLVAIVAKRYPHIQFYYEGIDIYIPPPSLVTNLNYYLLLGEDKALYDFIAEAKVNVQSVVLNNFIINKIEKNFFDYTAEQKFDVVFFAAFAPRKQPIMWEQDCIEKIKKLMQHNSILTTYSAKGSFKRLLKANGFWVEKIPGPPRKREMTRAGLH